MIGTNDTVASKLSERVQSDDPGDRQILKHTRHHYCKAEEQKKKPIIIKYLTQLCRIEQLIHDVRNSTGNL